MRFETVLPVSQTAHDFDSSLMQGAFPLRCYYFHKKDSSRLFLIRQCGAETIRDWLCRCRWPAGTTSRKSRNQCRLW